MVRRINEILLRVVNEGMEILLNYHPVDPLAAGQQTHPKHHLCLQTMLKIFGIVCARFFGEVLRVVKEILNCISSW